MAATASKTKKTAPKKPGIVKVEDQGEIFIDCRGLNDQAKDTALNALGEILGYHEVRRFNHIYPVTALYHTRDSLIQEFRDYGEPIEQEKNRFNAFLVIIDDFAKSMKDQLDSKITQGVIEFNDIPYLLEKGTKVSTSLDGEKIGGVIESVKIQHSFFGSYYKVELKVINNVYGHISDMPFRTNIGAFSGLKKIADLPVSPISDDEIAQLTMRGELFRKYASGAHYIHYKGQVARNSWWSSKKFRADGRAMIDVSSFSQVDNNQFNDEGYASGIEEAREDRGNKVDIEIPDADLWRTYPFVYGFSLSAKQWGRFAVSGISEIKFRTDAFEKLVLPAEDKELVKAIVQDDSNDFSDLIDGKGGGSIFLLHGPPGQGKTLTAEAIAEELKRPLYSISVGELGTNPQELEDTLREILDVATVWDSVLLLDEADIFLEERDEKDIVRNAMVGVFLRLLEYHQGVLFLTTNRVKNIDKAFYSRISIGLRFGDGTVDKRRSIWKNLTEAASVDGLDIDQLAMHDLNGRQIKNVIKLAIKLARSKGNKVDNALIDSVIERTNNFANEPMAGELDR